MFYKYGTILKAAFKVDLYPEVIRILGEYPPKNRVRYKLRHMDLIMNPVYMAEDIEQNPRSSIYHIHKKTLDSSYDIISPSEALSYVL